MSYPQPTSSKSVLEGQEFFRLHTQIDSNGDIYEIDTSVKAIVIGPNSDIQSARVYYYDAQAGGSIASALISVNDPFITRMNALMGSEYDGLGSKARILVTSDDLVPNLPGMPFVEPQLEGDVIVWNRPQLDLLCYHVDPPGIPATRAERQWQSAVTINDRGAGTGISSYYFPTYRRKYFHVRWANPTNIAALTYRLYGITFHQNYRTIAYAGYPGVNWDWIADSTFNIGASWSGGEYVLYADQAPDLSSLQVYPSGYFDYMLLVVFGPAIDGGLETTRLSYDIIATDWV